MSIVFRAIKAFRDPVLPENFFRVEVNILRTFGIEMLEEESWAYTIYSRIVLFILVYSFTAIESLEMYYQWGDLDALVDVVSYLFTHIGGLVKVTLLFYNRKNFGKMLTVFHTPPFAPDDNRGGKVEGEYIRKAIKATELQIFVYMVFVSITLFAAAFRCTRARLFSAREGWAFPFAPITPVQHTNSPIFETMCLYQFVCVSLYAVVIVTTDVLLCSIMAQLSVQFKILDNAFKTIRGRSGETHKKNPHGRSEGECLEIILGEYIEHHCEVYRFALDLEELINLLVLGATSMDVALLCFLLYQCSMHPLGSAPFLQNFFYYWIIVCQVSMYCYWGEEVTAEAENVSIAAGLASWPGAPLSVPKGLVMVIARSQKPLYMTIGKFFPLSMNTLMSMLKGSFSYFTVMRQTQQIDK